MVVLGTTIPWKTAGEYNGIVQFLERRRKALACRREDLAAQRARATGREMIDFDEAEKRAKHLRTLQKLQGVRVASAQSPSRLLTTVSTSTRPNTSMTTAMRPQSRQVASCIVFFPPSTAPATAPAEGSVEWTVERVPGAVEKKAELSAQLKHAEVVEAAPVDDTFPDATAERPLPGSSSSSSDGDTAEGDGEAPPKNMRTWLEEMRVLHQNEWMESSGSSIPQATGTLSALVPEEGDPEPVDSRITAGNKRGTAACKEEYFRRLAGQTCRQNGLRATVDLETLRRKKNIDSESSEFRILTATALRERALLVEAEERGKKRAAAMEASEELSRAAIYTQEALERSRRIGEQKEMKVQPFSVLYSNRSFTRLSAKGKLERFQRDSKKQRQMLFEELTSPSNRPDHAANFASLKEHKRFNVHDESSGYYKHRKSVVHSNFFSGSPNGARGQRVSFGAGRNSLDRLSSSCDSQRQRDSTAEAIHARERPSALAEPGMSVSFADDAVLKDNGSRRESGAYNNDSPTSPQGSHKPRRSSQEGPAHPNEEEVIPRLQRKSSTVAMMQAVLGLKRTDSSVSSLRASAETASSREGERSRALPRVGSIRVIPKPSPEAPTGEPVQLSVAEKYAESKKKPSLTVSSLLQPKSPTAVQDRTEYCWTGSPWRRISAESPNKKEGTCAVWSVADADMVAFSS